MTPKLDEARLRELAADLRRKITVAMEVSSKGAREVKRLVNPQGPAAADAIDILLDALSAERERGDRAVGLLRPFERHYDLNDLDEWAHDNALEIPVYDLRAVKVFLATQKAEGA